MSINTDTQGRREKILVVEDNPINQKMTCSALRKLGFEPEVAINGKEAVIKGKTGDYDLILMDIHMPVLDGIESTKMIRAIEEDRGRHTPIIAVTALSEAKLRDRTRDAGMDDYLEKPFEVHQLKYMLNEHLNSSTGDDASANKDYYFAEVFDRRHLLERCMGDQEMAEHLLLTFLRDTERHLQELSKALDEDDMDHYRYTVYQLRGAAGNICAGEIFHLTDSLLHKARADNKEENLKALESLRQSFRRFMTEVEG